MRRAKAVTVNEAERAILEQIIRQTTSAQGLVKRSQIILDAAAGAAITAQARQMPMERNSIQKWRERWAARREERAVAQQTDQLREAIEQTLADAPRSGTPATFSPEQIVQIVAIACETPQASGYPVSHWTPKEVAEEVMKRGIVEHISERQVGRFLKRG
jgi:putative transposase